MEDVYFKGEKLQTLGTFPKVGEKAPPFTLANYDLQDVFLKDFEERKKLFYFVPSIDTSVCAKSGKTLSDFAKEKPEVLFLVISADLPFAQQKFCVQECIANMIFLSCFRAKDFGKDYGVLMKNGAIAGLLARAILVLDTNNRVIFSKLSREISEHPDFSEPMALL